MQLYRIRKSCVNNPVLLTEAEHIRDTLAKIALQAYNIGMALQSAAPLTPEGAQSKSVQYLLEVSFYLNKASQEIDALLVDFKK